MKSVYSLRKRLGTAKAAAVSEASYHTCLRLFQDKKSSQRTLDGKGRRRKVNDAENVK